MPRKWKACFVVKYIRPVDLVCWNARVDLEHTEDTIIYLAFPYTYETVNTLLIIITIVTGLIIVS